MSHHTLLSPSSASRWLVCNPSVWYQLNFPDDEESVFAAEGTLAHSLGELMIRLKLGTITKQKYDVELKKIKANELYHVAMLGYCEAYAAYVIESFYALQSQDKTAEIFIEDRLDLTEFVPEAFGTSDVVMVGGGYLLLDDLKYGKGVKVDADNNTQLKIYALGAYSKYGLFYDIQVISLTIYQPRLDNISTWHITITDLLDWANSVLGPAVEKTFGGTGNFIAGKHCQFCKGKATCRAASEFNLKMTKYEFSPVNTLTDIEISEVLDLAASLKSWAKAVEDHAVKQAIGGKKYPNYKLVEGKSNRAYIDEKAIVEALILAGYKKNEIEKTGLISITALEKIVSKADFNDHLSGLIIKPKGAPTLVPESDKRHAINSKESFLDQFKDDFE